MENNLRKCNYFQLKSLRKLNHSGPVVVGSPNSNAFQLDLLRKCMDSDPMVAGRSKYLCFELELDLYRRNSDDK